jgi:hypothetical protein
VNDWALPTQESCTDDEFLERIWLEPPWLAYNVEEDPRV